MVKVYLVVVRAEFCVKSAPSHRRTIILRRSFFVFELHCLSLILYGSVNNFSIQFDYANAFGIYFQLGNKELAALKIYLLSMHGYFLGWECWV